MAAGDVMEGGLDLPLMKIINGPIVARQPITLQRVVIMGIKHAIISLPSTSSPAPQSHKPTHERKEECRCDRGWNEEGQRELSKERTASREKWEKKGKMRNEK